MRPIKNTQANYAQVFFAVLWTALIVIFLTHVFLAHDCVMVSLASQPHHPQASASLAAQQERDDIDRRRVWPLFTHFTKDTAALVLHSCSEQAHGSQHKWSI